MRRTLSDAQITIADARDAFLKRKQIEVQANEISPARYPVIKRHLEVAAEYMTGEAAIDRLNGDMLDGVRHYLLKQIADRRLSHSYAKDVLKTLKNFIRWCGSTGRIKAMPTNIDDRGMKISVPTKSITTLSCDEVKKLIDAANDRTRLYILLMLNCGMTQKDVAVLRRNEVDLKLGTITRKRSKTAAYEGVPTVTYRLWRDAQELLTREQSEKGDLALLTREGMPLMTESVSESGKYRRLDAIRLAFRAPVMKTGISATPRILRKTSATLIDNKFLGLGELFLGHAPRTIKDKHYAKPPQDLLDEALAWLATQYGVE